MTLIARMKETARARFADWRAVRGEVSRRRALEDQDIAQDREIRRFAWRALTGLSADRWTCLVARYAHAFGDGDRNSIHGFDDVAQEAACLFPQFAGRDDSDDVAERLFEYLAADPLRETDAESLYLEVIDQLSDRDACANAEWQLAYDPDELDCTPVAAHESAETPSAGAHTPCSGVAVDFSPRELHPYSGDAGDSEAWPCCLESFRDQLTRMRAHKPTPCSGARKRSGLGSVACRPRSCRRDSAGKGFAGWPGPAVASVRPAPERYGQRCAAPRCRSP